MKVFISHAAVDKEVANKLVELLEFGIGVPETDIFFSSQAGMIENGAFFVQRILTHLSEADLVISILSRAYLKSQFCIAETGAAMMKHVAVTRSAAAVPSSSAANQNDAPRFFSLVLPPAQFSDLGGVLHGVQSGSIASRETITELRELFRSSGFSLRGTEMTWTRRLEEFINSTAKVITETAKKQTLEDGIRLEEVRTEYREDLVHKRKIHFNLRNGTDSAIVAGPAQWRTGEVPLEKVFSPLRMRVKVAGNWSEDQDTVNVRPGGQFSAWISLLPAIDDAYLFSRSAVRRVGNLDLHLESEGVKAKKTFEF